MSWKTLGAVLPQRLTEARLDLHWAMQLASAPGASLLAPEPDLSHTSCVWLEEHGALAGQPVSDTSLRAGLVFRELEVAILDGDRKRGSLSLAGRTLDEGRVWLAGQLGVPEEELRLPQHEMPKHPAGEGGVFSGAGADERAELAAWFSNATQIIEALVADDDRASQVRCWPHHFDIASLVTLDTGEDPEAARSIGIGLSPGDASYDQPYFYVTPWPYPEVDVLPELAAGARWHTSGWTGAVLTADRLLSITPEDRESEAQRVLESAISAARQVLGD